MACGICKPFSTPPHRRRTSKQVKKEGFQGKPSPIGALSKEFQGKFSSVDALCSRPTPKPKLLNLNSLISLDLAMPSECVTDLVRPDRQYCISVSRCLTSIGGVSRVIFGYWVGPDIEDGWGFVEATLDRVL